MGIRGAGVAVLLLAAVAYVSPPAAATGPLVENVSWTPWVPTRGENVTIEADISDPDGISYASAAWCVLPPFTCILYDMSDPDADGRWTTDRGVLVVTNKSFHGAYFNVTAIDSNENIGFSPYYFVQFADGVVVESSLTPSSTAPGGRVDIQGTALYAHDTGSGLQPNASTPAMYSSVDIRIAETGAMWSTTTDGAGAFASGIDAPMNTGSYTVNATVSNRTITGSQERYLVVATVPTPDLAVKTGSLSVVPNPARAGDVVTISFTVENRGDATANGFSVRLAVEDSSSQEVFSHVFAGQALAASETRLLSASWTAAEGSMTVRVVVDPDGQIAELSESNNAASLPIAVEGAPPEGMPTTLIAALVFLGVGIAAVAVLVYRRRQGKTT